jgi:hypothetical protein
MRLNRILVAIALAAIVLAPAISCTKKTPATAAAKCFFEQTPKPQQVNGCYWETQGSNHTCWVDLDEMAAETYPPTHSAIYLTATKDNLGVCTVKTEDSHKLKILKFAERSNPPNCDQPVQSDVSPFGEHYPKPGDSFEKQKKTALADAAAKGKCFKTTIGLKDGTVIDPHIIIN